MVAQRVKRNRVLLAVSDSECCEVIQNYLKSRSEKYEFQEYNHKDANGTATLPLNFDLYFLETSFLFNKTVVRPHKFSYRPVFMINLDKNHEEKFAYKSYEFGAFDYLVKPIDQQRLCKAMERLLNINPLHFSKSFSNTSSKDSIPEPMDQKSFIAIMKIRYHLKKTEALICYMILLGRDRAYICNHLSITKKTMKNHLNSIYKKTINLGMEEKDHTEKLYALHIFLENICF